MIRRIAAMSLTCVISVNFAMGMSLFLSLDPSIAPLPLLAQAVFLRKYCFQHTFSLYGSNMPCPLGSNPTLSTAVENPLLLRGTVVVVF
jgi:hypothetical protein